MDFLGIYLSGMRGVAIFLLIYCYRNPVEIGSKREVFIAKSVIISRNIFGDSLGEKKSFSHYHSLLLQ